MRRSVLRAAEKPAFGSPFRTGAVAGLLTRRPGPFGAAVAVSCLKFGYNRTSRGRMVWVGNGMLPSQEG